MEEEIKPAVQGVKSKKDTFADRLKKKHADKEFADDEAMFGQINDDYDDYDKKISQYKDDEKALSDMFSSDPRSASFISEWANGGDPAMILVKMFGGDNLKDALDDPTKAEEFAKANKEYLDRVSENKKYEEQYKKNIQTTVDNLDEVQKKHGLTDDQTDEVLKQWSDMISDGVNGLASVDVLEGVLKSLNYDKDVKKADEEGEVRGRNTKIEEKLRHKKQGDGMPQLDGKNGGTGKMRGNVPNLGALDRYSDENEDIFARGGEKRTKYE